MKMTKILKNRSIITTWVLDTLGYPVSSIFYFFSSRPESDENIKKVESRPRIMNVILFRHDGSLGDEIPHGSPL